ncbi:hypothetical protein LCGC14_0363820 [marine sediment metagenome]|uniref:Uncharacterized protein n=1 Tax=marine sediment metagenome TaxID=412755 RepID=A0A0F9WFI3_9ZZZZ
MTHLSDFGNPHWLAATDIHFGHLEHGRQIEAIVKAFEGIGFVAGGAARFALMPSAPNPSDIDIWMFNNHLDLRPLFALGYHDYGEANGTRRFARDEDDLPVQIILPSSPRSTKSWGTPLEVLLTFTFTTEQFVLMYGAGGASGLLSTQGREDTENRVIRNNNFRKNPILSLYRLHKYGRKGYTLSMETLIEITEALHGMSQQEYVDALSIALSVQS